jgi:predicted RNA-binding protein associated with RNAse of E/G family
MKRRFADRAEWPRILKRRFYQQYLAEADFQGWVTLLCLDEVREPFTITFHGEPICLVNHGYTWLQHFPEAGHFSLTTMFDADSRVVQWYIDISRQNGLDQRGIPWWDDLYLDVVVFTSGEVMLLDEDELEQARQDGEIDQADYELAREEAERLLTAITANQFPLLQLSQTHRGLLLAKSNRF